jgi:hypothetical protein
MRLVWPALILLSMVAGCGPAAETGVAVVSGVSIPIFHRTPVDMAMSLATGRDCSVVHVDNRTSYCSPRDRPPETPEFCTRSLGVPDCWADSTKLTNHPREIADGPRTLTPEQEDDRTKWWLGLW